MPYLRRLFSMTFMVFASSVCASTHARAGLVTYAFTGRITQATGASPVLPGGGFEVEFAFDNSTSAQQIDGDRLAAYSPISIALSARTPTAVLANFSDPFGFIQLLNDDFVDFLGTYQDGLVLMATGRAGSPEPRIYDEVLFVLNNSFSATPGTLLNTNQLSDLTVDFSQVFTTIFEIRHTNFDDPGSNYFLKGDITSFSVLAVPEPSSLTMLAVGGLGLLGFARRREA